MGFSVPQERRLVTELPGPRSVASVVPLAVSMNTDAVGSTFSETNTLSSGIAS